ncbi:carbonic anhydrase 1-like [Babylonia areolata]|uniref:carbonic anhydrase 1-like n=1 Tax=Babylonia areolata TaxID=304850 RepID=UPI003FCFC36D
MVHTGLSLAAAVCLLVCLMGLMPGVSGGKQDVYHMIKPRAAFRLSTAWNRDPGLRVSRRRRWRYPAGGFNATRTKGSFRPSVGIRIPVNNHAFGPSKWPSMYPQCSGRRQSPINIQTSHVHFSVLEHVTLINFRPQTASFSVSFDGDTVTLTPRTRLYVQGMGVRGTTYCVGNIHFHWSSQHDHGSEHAINGVLLPLEMHILCYAHKYGSLTKAKSKKDGLAVLAVLFDLGNVNPTLWRVVAATDFIHNVGDEVPIVGLDIRQLMPTRLEHCFRYYGSMTTPPCAENVIWTVFEHMQTLSIEQFQAFQALRQGLPGRQLVASNSRPIQASFRRSIVSNNPVFRAR